MRFANWLFLLSWLSWLQPVWGGLVANESSEYLFLGNDRLMTRVNKAVGGIDLLALDGQDLLGPTSGSQGLGPYLDCYCIPSGFWTPGKTATYQLIEGRDGEGVAYGGVVMSDQYAATGQVLEQYWFLRETETGLHTFSRLAYHNATTPFLRNLQEFRTLFRPNTDLWTHLVTNEQVHAPLPKPNPANPVGGSQGEAVTVQDATWDLSSRGSNDPYVQDYSDYFTKYTFAATWRNHKAHGLFGQTANGTFGAWLVMNSKDTYFGGPLHTDLVVDGILYNYLVSNHHGAGTPNITDGFDRTFGPQYYHFNRGPAGESDFRPLYREAVQLADDDSSDGLWNAAFYDAIAEHVPNYVPSTGRGRWTARVQLPADAKTGGGQTAVAILSQDGVDVQDNVQDTTAKQYWAEIGKQGQVTIDRIQAGTYRLTIYADGVFGDYVQDGIVVRAGKTTKAGTIRWRGESAGRELWRIGTPDKRGGEWRHGDSPDTTHPGRAPEYRIYFGAYDFVDDFPEGVRFHVGHSREDVDWNYIHWSVFGGKGNAVRPEPVVGNGEINNWTVVFDLDAQSRQWLRYTKTATLTIQLAGAKTAAGNTDIFNASQPYNNLPLVVAVNGHALPAWTIPYYQSSSCGVRSGVACYHLSHKFVFPTRYLTASQTNEIVLSLPYNGTDYQSAVLSESLYVQYDALRLEVK